MGSSIPQSHADLLHKKAFASLATLNPDGSPQVTPVWCDFDGTNILINTAAGRKKERNLEHDGRVAVAIIDPDNPYRYLGIQGRVIQMTQDGADAHIDKLAKKYMGVESYPLRTPGEVRVIVKIAPEHVHTMG